MYDMLRDQRRDLRDQRILLNEQARALIARRRGLDTRERRLVLREEWCRRIEIGAQLDRAVRSQQRDCERPPVRPRRPYKRTLPPTPPTPPALPVSTGQPALKAARLSFQDRNTLLDQETFGNPVAKIYPAATTPSRQKCTTGRTLNFGSDKVGQMTAASRKLVEDVLSPGSGGRHTHAVYFQLWRRLYVFLYVCVCVWYVCMCVCVCVFFMYMSVCYC